MPATLSPHETRPGAPLEARLRTAAAAAAALMAVVYLLIYAGVLSIGPATRGDLGILGVAGLVFLALAALLWWVRSRALWIGAAAFQVLLTVMYVVVSAERDPAFEVWGLTIRVVGGVLFALLVGLVVVAARRRRA